MLYELFIHVYGSATGTTTELLTAKMGRMDERTCRGQARHVFDILKSGKDCMDFPGLTKFFETISGVTPISCKSLQRMLQRYHDGPRYDQDQPQDTGEENLTLLTNVGRRPGGRYLSKAKENNIRPGEEAAADLGGPTGKGKKIVIERECKQGIGIGGR